MTTPPTYGDLTPREYAWLTPEVFGSRNQFRRYCRASGLPDDVKGYGLLLCDTTDGKHVTIMTSDMEYWAMVRQLADEHGAGGLEIPPGKFPWRREGWPDEWTGTT